jgi:hypothetical protein
MHTQALVYTLSVKKVHISILKMKLVSSFQIYFQFVFIFLHFDTVVHNVCIVRCLLDIFWFANHICHAHLSFMACYHKIYCNVATLVQY